MFHSPTLRLSAGCWQEIACRQNTSKARSLSPTTYPDALMNSSPSTPARSAFTLMELLIVIAIIGILMSLLFPAANSAIDAAKKAQAKNDAVQIATAVIAYETEYGKLPDGPTETGADINSTLLGALTGLNTNNNPRKIVFLEVNLAKKNKSGVDSLTAPTKFVDPWSNSFKIVTDANYDHTITAKGTSLRKKVAVWTEPTGTYSNRRAVVSWE